MNCGAVTLLSELQSRRQGKGIKVGVVMAWASLSDQNRIFHKIGVGPLSVTAGARFYC